MRRGIILVVVLFMVGITLPYVLGFLTTNESAFFTGFIANPVDSFSYLAKMRQGYDGAWLFTLPFASKPSTPAFLFEYYLLLGHLARWLNISLIFVYHMARLMNSGLLLWAIWKFVDTISADTNQQKTKLWSIIVLGSGLGWIAAIFQQSTSDLWVAEAYPFLAAYTNPHFPLAISLMLFLFILVRRNPDRFTLAVSAFCSIVLSIIQPFSVVLVGLVLGIQFLLDLLRKNFNKQLLLHLLVIGGFALPFAIFYQTAISQDTLLKQWNSQNITLSAAWWDVLIAFSPAIPFALTGLIPPKTGNKQNLNILWIWVMVGFGFLLLPIQLQRRFLIGLYIPVTILAWEGIKRLSGLVSQKKLLVGYQILAYPTTFLLILLGIFGVLQRSPFYFLQEQEKQAIEWVGVHSRSTDVIFSDSETSLYIPGMTNRRVVYAHPYETPGAVEKQNYFYSCLPDFSTVNCRGILQSEDVRFILINSVRSELSAQWNELPYPQVYSNDRVKIYEVK